MGSRRLGYRGVGEQPAARSRLASTVERHRAGEEEERGARECRRAGQEYVREGWERRIRLAGGAGEAMAGGRPAGRSRWMGSMGCWKKMGAGELGMAATNVNGDETERSIFLFGETETLAACLATLGEREWEFEAGGLLEINHWEFYF